MNHPKPAEPIHHFVDAGDIRIHYVEVPSQNPPMVLLHGIGVDWRVWQAASRRLAPDFHLYIPDLRGHGQSDKPPSGYGLADYAGDIARLIEILELTDVAVVGSSLGAMVTVTLEASRDVISHRVLVDPPLVPGSGRKRSLFEWILTIKESGVPVAEQPPLLLEVLRPESNGAGRAFLRYMAETWSLCPPGVLREALNPAETPEQIEAVLTSVDSPTLVLRGNLDRGSVLTEEGTANALRLLPHGHELYFPNSGHAIHGTEPAAFVNAVKGFVRSSELVTT